MNSSLVLSRFFSQQNCTWGKNEKIYTCVQKRDKIFFHTLYIFFNYFVQGKEYLDIRIKYYEVFY